MDERTARILQLAALARRAWPDTAGRADVLPVARMGGYSFDVRLDTAGFGVAVGSRVLASIFHPRALDALEAALLVLAVPESGADSIGGMLDVYRSNIALRAKLAEVSEPDDIVKAYDLACIGLEARIAVLEGKLEKFEDLRGVIRDWRIRAHAAAHDHDGATYELGVAAGIRECIRDVRECIDGPSEP